MIDTRKIFTWCKTPTGKFSLAFLALMFGLSIFAYAAPDFYAQPPENKERKLLNGKKIFDKEIEGFIPAKGVKKVIIVKNNNKPKSIKIAAAKINSSDLDNIELGHKGRLVNAQNNSGLSNDEHLYNSDNINGRMNDNEEKIYVPVLDLYTSTKDYNEQPIGEYFAPYGRILSVQLINTIDSSAGGQGPVICILRESVYHNGLEILPAGVELHGFTAGVLRDKITCGKEWIVVFRTPGESNYGKEMEISGIALDDGRVGESDHYTINAGSAGITGYSIKTEIPAKLMSVASSFIAGMGQGMVTSQTASTGAMTEQTFGGDDKSMYGQAMNRSATLLAELMLDEIRRNGNYVRVPGGTNFSIYVTMTLNLENAKIGRIN